MIANQRVALDSMMDLRQGVRSPLAALLLEQPTRDPCRLLLMAHPRRKGASATSTCSALHLGLSLLVIQRLKLTLYPAHHLLRRPF